MKKPFSIHLFAIQLWACIWTSAIVLVITVIFSGCEKDDGFDERTVNARLEVVLVGSTTITYNIDGPETTESLTGNWSTQQDVRLTKNDANEFVSASIVVGPGVSNISLRLFVDGNLVIEQEWLQGMSPGTLDMFYEIK